jgi:hypothetical protein
MLLTIVSLPAQATGRVPAPPAAPVLGAAGSVVVLTDPPGARAWICERFLGTTPVRADSLAPGRLQIIVAPRSAATQWRRPHLFYADVRAGTLDTLRIDLRGTAGSVSEFDEPVRVRAVLGAERSSLPRLGTVLPMAALGLGAAGAWARHSADAAYRDYLRALDRGRMEDRYRRAHRLDRVSVACWIGAEACLAGAAWVWLHRDGPVPIAASFDDEGAVRLGLRVGGEDPRSPARECVRDTGQGSPGGDRDRCPHPPDLRLQKGE